MRVWIEWHLCQKMGCTLTELREQPLAEMEVIMAFVSGEQDGQKELTPQQ